MAQLTVIFSCSIGTFSSSDRARSREVKERSCSRIHGPHTEEALTVAYSRTPFSVPVMSTQSRAGDWETALVTSTDTPGKEWRLL